MTEQKKFVPDILVGPSVLEQKDVDGINRLMKQLFDKAQEISRGKLTDILCQPNFRMIIFKDPDTNEVIGMASLYCYKALYAPGGVGRVEDVVIDERYRGKGLGKLIMQCLISLAKNRQLETLELTSNPQRVEANILYPKLGFNKHDTNYYVMDL
ncbi:MAG: GNAT family N-acetyltransferase [Candidatus Taylorbacteria bacterium]|nr:GNAT family N-acetyltransferase [Candidatus Taylorbacteria bacterium]